MAGIDKVWAPLGTHPIVWHSLHRFAPLAAATVLVVRSDCLSTARDLATNLPRVTIVAGGAERQDSVFNGLSALPRLARVAVHDVARPFASIELLQRALAATAPWRGVIPALPVTDTMKSVDIDGRVMSTVNRDQLRAVQTPQVFWSDALSQAHRFRSAQQHATDDAALLEAAGYTVYTVPGDPANFKITTEHDLLVARLLIDHGSAR